MANQQVTIYVDRELRRAYRMLAAETGRTFSEVVADAMMAYSSPTQSKTGTAPRGIGDPPKQSGSTSLDGSVAGALVEMANAIRELREEFGKAPPAKAPDTLQLRYEPRVEEAARRVVAFLDTIGAKGIQGTEFQKAIEAMGSTKGEIKLATAALRRMKVIRRLRRGWVLIKHLKARSAEGADVKQS